MSWIMSKNPFLVVCLTKSRTAMSEMIRIVERNVIPPDTIMIQGLPDAGLVGLIAASHLISKLELNEVAYLDSDLLPPIVVLHEGLPYSPLRIFGNDELLVLFSEIAVPAQAVKPLIYAVLDWCQSKKVKLTISLGGLPVQNRLEIDDPKVYGVGSNESQLQMLRENKIGIMEEGFMAGPQALTLRYSRERNLSALTLLAQSFSEFPDPEAAASILIELGKIINQSIDLSDLIERGEEIRLKARDIMKRTQPEMARMSKPQEYDLPLYT